MTFKNNLEMLLKQIAYFENLNSTEIQTILPFFNRVEIKKSEILIQQGSEGDSLYIIEDGRFNVFIEKENQKDKVGILVSGDIAGEMALLSNEPRNSTVIATRQSIVYQLSKNNFLSIINTHNSILLKITSTIIKRTNLVYKEHTLSGSHITRHISKQVILMIKSDNSINLDTLITHCININKSNKNIIFINQQDLLKQNMNKSNISRYLDQMKNTYSTVVIYFNDINIEQINLLSDYADYTYLVSNGQKPPSFSSEVTTFIKSMMATSDSLIDVILCHPENTKYPSNTSEWKNLDIFSRIHHIKPTNPKHIKRLCRFFLNKAVGIVLSGGAARGLSYVGVFHALEKLNVPIDVICGTSAGAIFGAPLAFGLNPTEIEDLFIKLIPVLQDASKELTIPNFSIIGGKKLNEFFMDICQNFFIEDLWLSFNCAAVNYNDKKLFFYTQGELWKALRCSASLPVFFPPLTINNQLFLDGSIINNLPVIHTRNNLLYGAGILISFELLSSKNNQIKYRAPNQLNIMDHLKNYFSKEKIILPSIFELLQEVLMINSTVNSENEKKQSDLHIELTSMNIGLMETNLKKLKRLIPKAYNKTITSLQGHPILKKIPYYKPKDDT